MAGIWDGHVVTKSNRLVSYGYFGFPPTWKAHKHKLIGALDYFGVNGYYVESK